MKKNSVHSSVADLKGARKSLLPSHFKPELAVLSKITPTGKNWFYEIKYDGYRILSFIDKGKVKLITRNDHDWTEKFPIIAQALEKLSIKNAILDGELVALNSKGISEFQLLQNSIENSTAVNLAYYLFDIPFFAGYDLSRVPLYLRKKLLKSLLPAGISDIIVYSEDITGEVKPLLKKTCQLGFEGLVAKRKDSYYFNKRTEDWVKLKCSLRQEFVICGYTTPQGKRQYFGALLIGYYDKKQNLHYAGHVGTGFTQQNLKMLYDEMQKIEQHKSPFMQTSQIPGVKSVHWLKPMLVGEVQFTEWTQEGVIRHPAFKGLRIDKKAKDVIKELPS